MTDYQELSALDRDDLLLISEAMAAKGQRDGRRMPSLFDHPVNGN